MILSVGKMRIMRHLIYRFGQKCEVCSSQSDSASLIKIGPHRMMLLVFAALSLAFVAGAYGPQWLAVLSVLICLALSIGLFLFEIYSPDYGFRMPWLQVQFDGAAQIGSGGRA